MQCIVYYLKFQIKLIIKYINFWNEIDLHAAYGKTVIRHMCEHLQYCNNFFFILFLIRWRAFKNIV